MKSRYSALRTIGTLALILAWVILILGVLAAIGSWIGLNNLLDAMNLQAGGVAFGGAIWILIVAILGFLQWYVLGKVLHLLVDVDDTTLGISQQVQEPVPTAQPGAEISGELKRQAQLIAANLETSQEIQQHVIALEDKLVSPATETAQLSPPEIVEVSGGEGGTTLTEAAEQSTSTMEESGEGYDKTVDAEGAVG